LFALVNWRTPTGPRSILDPTDVKQVTLGWTADVDPTDDPDEEEDEDDLLTPDGLEALVFWQPPFASGSYGPVFAVDPSSGSDPSVLYGELEDDTLDDWHDTRVPLSKFLLVAAVADALAFPLDRPHRTLLQLSPEQHDEATGSLLRLTDPLWDWENGDGDSPGHGSWYWCSAEGDLLAHSHHVGRRMDRGSILLDWPGPEWDVDEDEYALRLVALRPEALAPYDGFTDR
jgi:hypothetical protein